MKIILKQKKERDPEIEVIILYAEMNDDVREIVNSVRTVEDVIAVKLGEERRMIRINEIYYIETTDRKIFLYTKDQVYRIDKNLSQLYEQLSEKGFSYISRKCILNLNKLKSICTLYNSRLQGTLTNGEKVDITRTYVSQVKKYFSRGV